MGEDSESIDNFPLITIQEDHMIRFVNFMAALLASVVFAALTSAIATRLLKQERGVLVRHTLILRQR